MYRNDQPCAVGALDDMNPHTIIDPVTALLITRQRGNVCLWVDEHKVLDMCKPALFCQILFVNRDALMSGRVAAFGLS